MHECQQLTDFQKGQIEGRRRSLSPAKIGNELNIPGRTVANFLTRFDNRSTIENLPQSGRPRKTSSATSILGEIMSEKLSRVTKHEALALLHNGSNQAHAASV
jgi:hypothetical protein